MSIYLRFILFILLFSCLSICLVTTGGRAEEKKEPDAINMAAGYPPELTVQQCIEIAVKQHPDVTAAVHTVRGVESKIVQAQAGYYPKIEVTSDYRRYTPLPLLTGYSSNLYSTYATLSQNVYDFGRTSKQVSIQRHSLNSSQSDLENVLVQTAFNVKSAYYGLLKARKDKEINTEIVQQFSSHLKQAEGFFEEGLKPKFDVTKALVDLSNAQLNLIRAENALKEADLVLKNAMSLPETVHVEIKDTLSFQQYKMPFEEAIKIAYEVRSDLISLIAKKKAAEAAVALSRKDYYPTFSLKADYGFTNERFPLKNDWAVDLTLTFPIFTGFQTTGRVDEAVSNLKVLCANEASLRERILLEVKQASLNLREAESRIATARLGVKQAEENLDLANGRYEGGIGSPIEVTDAVVSFSNAKTSYTQALYDYQIAQSNLEKAIGIR